MTFLIFIMPIDKFKEIYMWKEFKWLGPGPVARSYESSMCYKYVKLFK
jgi:hypothetical protein